MLTKIYLLTYLWDSSDSGDISDISDISDSSDSSDSIDSIDISDSRLADGRRPLETIKLGGDITFFYSSKQHIG